MVEQLDKPTVQANFPLDELAWRFKALADPARLKILLYLAHVNAGQCCPGTSSVCACDFEAVTGLSQPTVSHHMKTLISANLVMAEKRGKWMYYRLDPEGFAHIKEVLGKLG